MSEWNKRQSDIDPVECERTGTRVFSRDGDWFFTSREGDMGPYDTQAEAEEQLDAYVGLVDLRDEDESPVTPDIEEDQRA
ncbi:MAG: DUF6316 family protein [Pseudomonadota bacterium]